MRELRDALSQVISTFYTCICGPFCARMTRTACVCISQSWYPCSRVSIGPNSSSSPPIS